ncbi:dienelactone hydrolase family protein [Lapillicoccus jejuensis]|uniref:Carboxymethylenebutenolidase n=1 Tax=Lapillicoccus jejuensis TaxID=402171 RepID=A0A542DYD8_9MICO|nr:dienelactone hydrolase family protein [Lapillicoccus jejuensis]TQJ08069.1 carboxymethylenebutenolidase [Lapillicoccus jejuensis]
MDLIEIPVNDGTAEAYVARPASGSGPGVLLFMDAIGLRPQIARMADRIAGWGYVVLAPNVFWREGSAQETSPTADLREPGAREEFMGSAMGRVGRLTTDQAQPDIAAYLDALAGLDGVVGDKVGVVGYCMGVRLALRAASRHPERVAAVGGFHGGGLVTDEPDSPHLGLANARAEFVLGHADHDGSMPPEAVQALGEALEKAGLRARNEIYPDAPHGYSMADTSMYQEAGAERSFTELEELYRRTLG